MVSNFIGQQFGQYKLTELLGSGGFAEVYLGEHVHLKNHQAAVKLLNHTHLTPNDREQFRQEAQIIANLKHRHIVRIFDFGVEGKENVPFLVMEYAPHGSLRQSHPKGTHLSLSQAADYVNQIAEALQHAHNHRDKIIHCDIKPENMLLISQNEVLLSDFGIAILTHTTTPIGQRITERQGILGTLEYMAPERFDGKPCQASDQYSLGVVVYEWLCGKPPFQGDTLHILAQHMGDSPPSLHQQNSAIPPAVEEVVLRALEKKPESRYPSITDFNKAFQQASRLPLTPIPPPKSGIAPQKRFSIKNVLIVTTAVILLVTSWIVRGAADGQPSWILPQPPIMCFHTFRVTTDQDNASGSFREMVDKAQDGDCITFGATLTDKIVLTNELDIKHSITIQGNGLLPQQIKPSNMIQADIKAAPTITNGTYRNTNITIFPNTRVMFINLSFQGTDTSLDNSLISNQSQDLNIIFCSFHSFHSSYVGSVISNLQGNLTLKDSYLKDNQSLSDGGGAIYNQAGTLTLDHSTVTSNYADYSGGGIYDVGGKVYLKNRSSLNSNKLGAQDANQGGGGGGIISRGGTIAISDSEITDNAALGDGGGIFLVDASAQITSSTITSNSAPSQKGGDIAVEAHLDNGPHNYLFIDRPTSYGDIWGDADQKDPRMIYGKPSSTPPGYDPTKNNLHFLGPLTTEQFRTHCKQLKGKSFSDVIMGTDEKSIKCISGDNNASSSFADLNLHIKDLCVYVYSGAQNSGNKESMLARLASYWNPSSWQCFGNEQKKEKSITVDPTPSGKGTQLDRYCENHHHGTHAQLPHLPPDKQTGYQWKCANDDYSNPHRISMAEACKEAYGNFAVDVLETYTDPYSWYCWVPI